MANSLAHSSPTKSLDAIDRKILTTLQADGRISLAELAAKVGLSPSPCLRRMRLLEESGIIARYVAVLDQEKVGLPASVFVSIKLESQREEALNRFTKAIARWPEVLECYLMTGPRDYLLRVVVADLAAYDRFLKQKLTRLEGIASIEFELRTGAGQIHECAAAGVRRRVFRTRCSAQRCAADPGSPRALVFYKVPGLQRIAACCAGACLSTSARLPARSLAGRGSSARRCAGRRTGRCETAADGSWRAQRR